MFFQEEFGLKSCKLLKEQLEFELHLILVVALSKNSQTNNE